MGQFDEVACGVVLQFRNAVGRVGDLRELASSVVNVLGQVLVAVFNACQFALGIKGVKGAVGKGATVGVIGKFLQTREVAYRRTIGCSSTRGWPKPQLGTIAIQQE
jgi:hypothetical protein